MIHPDGHAELINDKHGFVVGGMEGMKYKDYELQMEPGSKLFLYTDGVPEATSADKGLFGTERMMDALSGTARTQNAGNVIEAEAGDAVQKQDAISAVALGDGAARSFSMTLGSLTDDERQIILDGCLINYYRNHH